MAAGFGPQLKRKPLDGGHDNMATVAFCGTTLLLPMAEFERRVGGDARQVSVFINAIVHGLSVALAPSQARGIRDLIITLNPDGRFQYWFGARNEWPSSEEQQIVHRVLQSTVQPIGLVAPPLFALTFALDEPKGAPLTGLRLPREWESIPAKLGKDAIDTVELLEYVWGAGAP